MFRSIVTVFLALACLLVACRNTDVRVFDHRVTSSSLEDAPSLKLAVSRTCDSLDPNRSGFHPVTRLLHGGLYQLGREGVLRSDLAQSESVSEDGLLWTIRLENASFHNGLAVQATDVVRALQSAIRSGSLPAVSMVEVQDETTLRILLSRPDPWLRERLANVAVVSESDEGPSGSIGIGPYRLVRFGNGAWLLERHEGYHGIGPRSDRILIVFVPDAMDRLRGVESGQFHLAMIDGSSLGLADRTSLKVHRAESRRLMYLSFLGDGPPTSALETRIEESDVVRSRMIVAAGGYGLPADTLLPGPFTRNTSFKGEAFGPHSADRQPREQDASARVTTPIRSQDLGEMFGRVEVVIANGPYPNTLRRLVGAADPALSDLLRTAEHATSLREQAALCDRVQSSLMERHYVVPILWPETVIAARIGITGFEWRVLDDEVSLAAALLGVTYP